MTTSDYTRTHDTIVTLWADVERAIVTADDDDAVDNAARYASQRLRVRHDGLQFTYTDDAAGMMLIGRYDNARWSVSAYDDDHDARVIVVHATDLRVATGLAWAQVAELDTLIRRITHAAN